MEFHIKKDINLGERRKKISVCDDGRKWDDCFKMGRQSLRRESHQSGCNREKYETWPLIYSTNPSIL